MENQCLAVGKANFIDSATIEPLQWETPSIPEQQGESDACYSTLHRSMGAFPFFSDR